MPRLTSPVCAVELSFRCLPALKAMYKMYRLVGCCCLKSHSAISQLYSDATAVQFPNFNPLPGTQRHGQLGVLSVPSLPRHGHQDVRRRILPPCHQRGPHAVGVCRESNPDRPIHSPAATSTPPRRTYRLVNGFRVTRDMAPSRRRGTTRVDEKKPFTNQFSSLCSVLRASKFSVFKLTEIVFLWVLLHHPSWLQLVLALLGHQFSTFETTLFG